MKWPCVEYLQTFHIVSSHFLSHFRTDYVVTGTFRLCAQIDPKRPLLWSCAGPGAVNQAVICTDTKMLLLNLPLGIDPLFLPGKCHSASRRFDNDQRGL